MLNRRRTGGIVSNEELKTKDVSRISTAPEWSWGKNSNLTPWWGFTGSLVIVGIIAALATPNYSGTPWRFLFQETFLYLIAWWCPLASIFYLFQRHLSLAVGSLLITCSAVFWLWLRYWSFD
jgi:hypothetical protein